MNAKETGRKIFELRKSLKYTQEEFGNSLGVNYRTVSKWERGDGLPDIGVLELISKLYGLDMAYLLSEEKVFNKCASAVKRLKVFVCEECDNVVVSLNDADIICHGKHMKKLKFIESEDIEIIRTNNELFVKLNGNMSKDDYVSFVLFILNDTYLLKKLYPEGGSEIVFPYLGKGNIVWYRVTKGAFVKRMI